jgi:hypothetical protein
LQVSPEPPARNDQSDSAAGAALQLDLFDDSDLLSRLGVDDEALTVREPIFGVKICATKIYRQLNDPPTLRVPFLRARLSTYFSKQAMGTGRGVG